MALKKSVFIVFFALCVLTGCGAKPDAVDSQGHAIRMGNYKGKWVLVNYWASWCVPCLRELPELEHVYQQHKDKLVVLGVSFDEWDNGRISSFAQKMHVTFPMLQSFPKEKYGVKRIPAVPVSLLISPEGKLVTLLNGPQEEVGIVRLMSG